MRAFSPALPPIRRRTGGTDADAQAFIDAAMLTDATEVAAGTQLITDFKDSGIWNRSVAIYPMLGGSASSHKWNAKNPLDTNAAFRLSFSGGLTHSSNGILPNGTTGYADTFIEANEHFPPYSMSVWYYSRTATQPGPADDKFIWGQRGSGGVVGVDFNTTSAIFAPSGVRDTADTQNVSISASGVTDFSGLWGYSQYGKTYFKLTRNGSLVAQNTTERFGYFPSTDPSQPNTIHLFADHAANGGAAQFYSNYQCAFAAFCYGLDDAMTSAMNTAVQAFQTTLGRSV